MNINWMELKDIMNKFETEEFCSSVRLTSKREVSLKGIELLFLVIDGLMKEKPSNCTFMISLNELSKRLNLSTDNDECEKEIEDLADQIMSGIIEIKESDDKWMMLIWMDSVRSNNDIWTFKLNNMLKSFFIGLRKHFTSLEIYHCIQVDNGYLYK